jgi:hypothetical protein
MNEQDYQQLRETSWKRPLTATERAQIEAYLSDHPEEKPEWEREAALNQLLDRLPAVPSVASNFTAQVMQAVAREARRPVRASVWPLSWFRYGWPRRIAAACLVLGACWLGWHEYRLSMRTEMARQIADVAEAIQASDLELIANYDPIRRLSDPSPAADVQLIALMQ